MPSKSSSPGPNATPSKPAKQTRSRKGSTSNQAEQGRKDSACAVMLPKKTVTKAPASSEKKATATTATTPGADDAATTGVKTPKKKPRKLNKEPTSTPADKTNSPTSSKIPNESLSNAELKALKSRVKELEAKMEELYKTRGTADSRAGRSPRRRGKGRKGSSAEQVPQVKPTENNAGSISPRTQEIVDDNEEEADEELVRLEGELEVARQDLEHYRPRMRRTRSAETDFVEEIPRTHNRATGGGERQVTLSGSYRIPIPSSVNLEDVQTIKSGVSAAQNLARSFLEQRRAAAAATRAQATAAAQDAQPASSRRSSTTTTKVPPSKTGARRSSGPNIEVAVDENGRKQSWSDWIGGYSMAISRAVSKIEHEAAVEAQMSGGNVSGARSARSQGNRRMSVPTSKRMAPAKPTLNAEQVHGLMS